MTPPNIEAFKMCMAEAGFPTPSAFIVDGQGRMGYQIALSDPPPPVEAAGRALWRASQMAGADPLMFCEDCSGRRWTDPFADQGAPCEHVEVPA